MRKFGFLAVALAAAISVGCSDDGVTGGNGTGRLRINLVDAPGDLEEAWVKIEEIVLVQNPADSTGQGSGRIVIEPTVTGWINLLNLTDGDFMEIADIAIPEGSYSQLRVVVDEAYVVLNDDRVFATPGADLPAGVTSDGNLKCPSCSQSGYKVKFAGEGLVINGTTFVTIDFDAGRSFIHEAGRSGQWIMHPVLHATATNHEFAEIAGNVTLGTGVTLPACGGTPTTVRVFRPLAVMAPDTFSAVVDTLGAYNIGGLFPGTYAIGFVNELSFTNGDSLTIAATPTPTSVTLAEGDSAVANYQITAATCH